LIFKKNKRRTWGRSGAKVQIWDGQYRSPLLYVV